MRNEVGETQPGLLSSVAAHRLPLALERSSIGDDPVLRAAFRNTAARSLLVRIILIMSLLVPVPLLAATIVPGVPDEIPTEKRYVFYLHGRIIEEQGPRPTHPRWGLYDYPAVLDALAQDGIILIAEQRAKGSDPDEYAQKIRGQVQQLAEAGVDAGNITVVGFSAGGAIAMKTSSIMVDLNINFVFLASCSGWLTEKKDLRLHGHVLSVYEESDGPLSCAPVASRKPGPSEFSEIEISTGKEHGAFYLPRDEWVQPVLDWIRSHP